MSENDKDNKDFQFIKEQVIEKKRKKIRKRLLPLFMTIILAILFGVIAAATFVITEPRLYKLLHKEEDNRTPVTFPTDYPEDSQNSTEVDPQNNKEEEETKNEPKEGDCDEQEKTEPETVIVEIEKSIDADLDDFSKMYDEIRKVASNANKSLVTISSTSSMKDWLFGEMVERTVNTTGVVIANNNADLLILVSLDRIKDASRIKIVFSDTVSVDATLQDYETEINLAMIAVSLDDIPDIFMNNITTATLGESYTLAIGNPILALGSPNGHVGSMDFGIITSKDSVAYITDNRLDLFNTDMQENSNSDGIIVNMDGEVIGVITRTLKDKMSNNLSTAIGISKLTPIIERMANQIPRICFGVMAEDITEVVKREHEIIYGIYVNEVQADSPAFLAGITSGDIILQVNEQSMLNTNYFNHVIAEYQPGDEINVKIKRTIGTIEKEMDLTVTLTEKLQ